MNEAINRFDRNNAKRAAQRSASHGVSRADAVATRDKQRATWTQHGRGQGGGWLSLDQKTSAAKSAALAEQRKTEPQQTRMETSTVLAILETWLRRNLNFYDSDFNGISMRNFLLRAWHEQGIAPSIELLDSAFAWLQANGHLEADPRIPRKRGDVARTAAARLFEYTTPEETEKLKQRQASEAIEKRTHEDAANRALDFDELKRRARTGHGPVSHEAILAYQG